MTEALFNHLWQSTLFALAAALLALACRRNSASLRFNIWLAASVKFLIPFSLCVLVGKQLRWETTSLFHSTPGLFVVMNELTQPGAVVTGGFTTPPTLALADAAPHWHWGIWTCIAVIWAVGFVVLLVRWGLQWAKLSILAETATPLDIEAPLAVRESTTVLEPGVFGIVSPVLLLPSGIAGHLAPEQLETVLAHELCHWQRKDNLTSAIHMLVEALFWFYPPVWWLGNRMIVERERACDEAVIQSGGDRQVYAEGILKVCRLYVEPPILCMSGVSGGTLRERIEDIMTNQVLMKLHFAKKCLLIGTGLVAIAGPVAVGLASGARGVAQAASAGQVAAGIAAGAAQPSVGAEGMRHYKSSEWNFELDIPSRWNSFPPVLTNSPDEVVRFISREQGVTNALIVFRSAYDPQLDPRAWADAIQQILAKGGFSSFVTGESTIGSRRVVTLDFEKMLNGKPWHCRQYFVVDGTLVYTLGFGTGAQPDMAFALFDRIAKTFVPNGAAS